MPTTIEVNKQSVEALLGSGKSKPFVIPEVPATICLDG